jgi:hypothetical protein
MIDSSTILDGIVILAVLGGSAVILRWRRPVMRSWAYVGRIALGLLWIWSVLAATVCLIALSRTGDLPSLQFFCKAAPGATIIGFLFVGMLVVSQITEGFLKRYQKPNKSIHGTSL